MATGNGTLQIWKGTRVSTVLLVDPGAIEVLSSFDPSLESLRDPQVRAVQAHRLSLADVASHAHRPVEEIISALEDHLHHSVGH